MAPPATALPLLVAWTLIIAASAATPPKFRAAAAMAPVGDAGGVAPSVYWLSSPTLHGETLLLAGAGLLSAQLCTDSTCSTVLSAAPIDAWEQSVSLELPAACTAGSCFVRANSTAGVLGEVIQVNAPDIWWSTASPPVQGFSVAAAYEKDVARARTGPGQALRIFGRSIAWEADGSTCLDGRQAVPSPSTLLDLHGDASVTVAASASNCHEATFSTAGLAPGNYPDALVRNAWGVTPLPTILYAAPYPGKAPALLDVDKDFGGNVTAALDAAAQSGSPAEVLLGASAYALSASLAIPNNTVLRGQGMRSTVLTFKLAESAAAVPLISGGFHWRLQNFSIVVVDAPAKTHVVHMAAGTTNFTATGLNITMLQQNVSNAIRVEGEQFELSWNELNQRGECLWPPTKDSSSFTDSVTLYLHNSRFGWIHHNVWNWQCTAFDLDVSQFYVVEDNVLHCTQNGTIPHGNSISGYDWHTNPSSRYWTYQRNSMTRPLKNGHPSLQNWVQRETVTTDGSGAWGTATLQSVSDNTAVVAWLDKDNDPVPTTTFLVLDGPGTGQHREVVDYDKTTNTVTLDSPLDGWVQPQQSTIAVVSSFGSTLIVGNSFAWAEVVQYYGNTIRGVHSSNDFTNCNVKGGLGSLQGVSECYHGSGQNFYTEWNNNHMVNSDGILLRDSSGPTSEPECKHYDGPWTRWAVVRRNSISGISDASRNVTVPGQKPACGRVLHTGNPTTPSTAIVAEHNLFTCPPDGTLPGGKGTNSSACDHCIFQP